MSKAAPTHAFVNAETIAVTTAPPYVGLGVTSLAAAPRPDLAGYRIQIPGQPSVWLIDQQGYKRGIPNPTTYNNLFRNWSGIVADVDANEIANGPGLDDGAVLLKGSATPSVYIIDGGKKRGITSPAVMDQYYFNWGTIVVIPDILVNAIPNGSIWA